mgnify:FL=1
MVPIRPVSDLRNRFAEISKDVHETGKPVFLTKNGRGDMVFTSMDAYMALEFDSEVYHKLAEAEREADETGERFSSDDVLSSMRAAIASAQHVA